MRIITFASGSTGNCSMISDGGVNILIDAGISARRITDCLAAEGLTPRDIGGVLITHEHSDHVSGLSVFTKKYGIKVYAPEKLCCVLKDTLPKLEAEFGYIPVGEEFDISGLKVRAFRTPHDAAFSCGYRIEGSGALAFATDTGSINDELLEGLCGADIAVIEANHDIKMLKNGAYPYYLKRRVLSERGHLSNDDCAVLAKALSDSGTKQIVLAHLSRENNTPEVALQTVSSAVDTEKTKIYTAPANKALEVSVEDRVQC